MKLIFDLVAGLTISATAVVVDAAAAPVAEYAGLLERFGVMACLLAYFLVRDYLRNKEDKIEKKELVSKLDNLEEFIREKLMDKLDKSSGIIQKNTDTNTRLLDAFETKAPCMSYAAKESKK